MANEIEKKYKEYEMLRLREFRKSLYTNPRLRQLFFEVTSRCNARCEHCGSRCDDKEQGKEIEAKYIKKVLKEVSEHYDPRYVMLNITGGEPLMRKDLFDLMAYAHELGFPWGMTTNGMLITKSKVEKMAETGMYSVSVSIDGLEKTHEEFRKVPGSYKKILKGLEYMQECPTIKVVQVTTVANKKNFHELEDIYKMLCDMNIKYWRVVNCDPIGRVQDHSDILLDHSQYKELFEFIRSHNAEGKMEVTYGCSHFIGLEYEKELRNEYFFCMAGLYVASVLSNGDIFVCPNVPRRKELIQGNVKKDSFIEVWENKFEAFRNEYRTSNETCKKCKYWKYCNGDSFHTWNFEENKPNICLKDIFDDEE